MFSLFYIIAIFSYTNLVSANVLREKEHKIPGIAEFWPKYNIRKINNNRINNGKQNQWRRKHVVIKSLRVTVTFR